MSQFHSMVSRRTFMKSLGLVSIGAAALTAPVFHDLDELTGATEPGPGWTDVSGAKHPWYVKEVDNPTVEIDWNVQKGCMSTIGANSAGKDGAESYHDTSFGFASNTWAKIYERSLAHKTEWMKAGKPGYSIKDWALRQAVIAEPGTPSLFVPDLAQFPTQGQLGEGGDPTKTHNNPIAMETTGVPKYQGTPEENTRMLKSARRFFGLDVIGSMPVDDHFMKLVYQDNQAQFDKTCTKAYVNSSGKQILAAGVPLYYSGGYYQESNLMWAAAPSVIAKTAHYLGNRQISIATSSSQRFIGALYYQAMKISPGPCPGFGVLCGMNELGRPGNSLNPEHGMASAGSGGMLFTDLPLAPTKPIDAGAFRFCSTCTKCANACPGGAIVGDPPSWDTFGPWSNVGKKACQNKMNLCRDSFFLNYACLMCTGNCVYTKLHTSMVHELVKTTVSATPLFNSFFTSMDAAFGYGSTPCDKNHNPDSDGTFNQSAADWWDMDLPRFSMTRNAMPG